MRTCSCGIFVRVTFVKLIIDVISGECWSGAGADVKYYTDGTTDTCVNKCYEPCRNSDRFCTGKGYTNFVYRVTTGKLVQYLLICFYDFYLIKLE